MTFSVILTVALRDRATPSTQVAKFRMQARQHHALALGYFFLAVFCVFTIGYSPMFLRIPLLIAAFLALAAGASYLAGPWRPRVSAARAWLARMISEARKPPERPSPTTDELSL